MLRSIWRSGWLGKSILLLLPVTLFGIYDVYRMADYFSRFSAARSQRQRWVAEHIIRYTPAATSGLDRENERMIMETVRWLRDSLTATCDLATNAPEGYEPYEVGVRYQLDSALQGYKLFTYADFRLACDCDESGYFRLVRFRINSNDYSSDLIADEVVEWLKYAPMDRVPDQIETNGRGLASNGPGSTHP
jgi:hypothetical protein